MIKCSVVGFVCQFSPTNSCTKKIFPYELESHISSSIWDHLRDFFLYVDDNEGENFPKGIMRGHPTSSLSLTV
jgi:hypothetical protein